MDLQVMAPSPAVDFNFDSTSTSPYATAPSSPQRFGNFYYSAPTSPTRASSFYSLNSTATSGSDGALSTIPFTWEEKPGIPKQKDDDDVEMEVDTDFAFDFSGQLERPSISAADELFDGGKIKPLKPPPRLLFSSDSPKSPKSPKSRFKEAFSPRGKKKDFDPFSEALKQTSKEQSENPSQRGRERTPATTRHKPSRSLSPFRVSDILSEEETTQKTSSNQSSSFVLPWYNKWNLKNLLLFRSASEGSATTSKDPLKKYSMLKKSSDDLKNSSFRSTDSGCSSGGSTSKRIMMRRKVSAHEIHYTANRAVAEEMKRKTPLPYKSGLLGCLGLHQNGGSVHEISRGISTVMRH